MNRRSLIVAATATVPLAVASPCALADSLSNRPIRIVVPFGAGGIADLTVRAVAQAMGEQLKTQVVIENKPGAGGIAAGETVARAAGLVRELLSPLSDHRGSRDYRRDVSASLLEKFWWDTHGDER